MEISILSCYRHKKTNGIYQVIELGCLELDETEVVVYRSLDDGRVWVRPVVEFADGRFEYWDK